MSDYAPSGNPATDADGSSADMRSEFALIETAIASKADLNSPTLVTPVLGVATATSINKISFTQPATGATVTIADGKTLTVSKTLTLTGTDGTTHTLPATNATLARTDAAQTFTGSQRFDGTIALGNAAAANVAIYDRRSATGGATSYGWRSTPTVLSDVTSSYNGNSTSVSTDAAAFTLDSLYHYIASQGTIGAGSAITNQYGFTVSSNMVGAGSNYAFHANIPNSAGDYNFYAAGTAPNYFAGKVGIGSIAPDYVTNYVSSTLSDITQATYVGLFVANVTAGSGAYSRNALVGQAFTSGAWGNAGTVVAVAGQAVHTIAGIATDLRGVSGYVGNTGSGTITNAYAFHASNSGNTGGGAITQLYGFCTGDLTAAGTNYGFYGGVSSGANKYNAYMAGTAANYFAGTIASLGSYNATTAVSANMAIASDGAITRATSSLRYKTDVETLDSARADAVVLGSRPVWYRSTCGGDNHSWGWYGLIAEELAEIDPRLVHWGRPSKEVEIPATDTEPATVTNVEDTSAPLRPEGVMYDRLTVMLLDVVKRQQAQIDALTVRVEALEA